MLSDLESKFRSKDGRFNFTGFMKCLEYLSYGNMFSDGNSKKFNFVTIKDKTESDLEKSN